MTAAVREFRIRRVRRRGGRRRSDWDRRWRVECGRDCGVDGCVFVVLHVASSRIDIGIVGWFGLWRHCEASNDMDSEGPAACSSVNLCIEPTTL
jgi:hypothetical protein